MNGQPPRNPPAPPKSTVARLLSSQRRSAVQSDRYRVQSASPFADGSRIDQAVGRPQQSSHPGRYRGDDQNDGSEKMNFPTFSSPGRSHSDRWERRPRSSHNSERFIPPNQKYRSFGSETDASPSRRVGFRPRSSVPKYPETEMDRPRKRKSRWDVRPPDASYTGSSYGHEPMRKVVRNHHAPNPHAFQRTENSIRDEGLPKMPPRRWDPPSSNPETTKQPLPMGRGNGALSQKSVPQQQLVTKSAPGKTGSGPIPQQILSKESCPTIDAPLVLEQSKVSGNNTQSRQDNKLFHKPTTEPAPLQNDPSVHRKTDELSSSVPKDNDMLQSIPKLRGPSSKADTVAKSKLDMPTINGITDVRNDGNESEISELSEDSSPKSKLGPGKKNNAMAESKPPKPSPVAKVENAPPPAAPLPKKKRVKYGTPFRFKVGCVATVRFNKLVSGGNSGIVPVVKDGESYHAIPSASNVESHPTKVTAKGRKKTHKVANVKVKAINQRKPSYHEVWSPPIPGQDDGLSLLGSWIRCEYPKSFIQKWQKKNKSKCPTKPRRTVEGNVISIISDDDINKRGITVCILIDRASVESLPYLHVVPDDSNDASSASKQNRRRLEAQIRGEDKVVVRVTLASMIDLRNGKKLGRGVVPHWVVRKRVSAKPVGKKPTKNERKLKNLKVQSLFVGDGNDSQEQQDHNWGWIASQTSCKPLCDDTDQFAEGMNLRDPVTQLVGEIVKVDVNSQEGSMATVTMKRLWTPEQTKDGRKDHHSSLELFDNSRESYFQAPIEQLIVMGKSVNRCDALDETRSVLKTDSGWKFTIAQSYNAQDNLYIPLKVGIASTAPAKEEPAKKLTDESFATKNGDDVGQAFSGLAAFLQSSKYPKDFALPHELGQLALRPSFLPLAAGMKSRSYKIVGTDGLKPGKRKLAQTEANSAKKAKTGAPSDEEDEEDEAVMKSGCSRAVPFDILKKSRWGNSKRKHVSNEEANQPFFRETCRPRAIKVGKMEEKTALTGRAARASQRRMVKSLAALGGMKKVDRLAGRDRVQLLRFDKSKIHGWGVFAEEKINAGDMIIEYRGELIGNAVADKRELEYEREKLDDYMFRIDAYTGESSQSI